MDKLSALGKRLYDKIAANPVYTYDVLKALAGLAIAFGLPLTPEQKLALGVAVLAGLSWLTNQKVTS